MKLFIPDCFKYRELSSNMPPKHKSSPKRLFRAFDESIKERVQEAARYTQREGSRQMHPMSVLEVVLMAARQLEQGKDIMQT